MVRFSIVLLCLIPRLLTAQEQRTLWFHHLQKADGLSDSHSIRNIFQDSEGFTWIDSQAGLNRFDGHTIKQYRAVPADSTSLADDYITGGFFEDREKNIWFCTNTAIHCYNRKTDSFARYYIHDKRGLTIRNGYYAIHLERDSLLWLRAGNKEFYYFDIHRREHSPMLNQTIFDINVFPGILQNGQLGYLFSVDGKKSKGLEIFTWDKKGQLSSQPLIFDKEPALHVHSVFFERDTIVWLAADEGIFELSLQSKQIRHFSTGTKNIKRITPVDDVHFLITDVGNRLFLFNRRTGEFTPFEARLLDDQRFNLNTALRNPFLDPSGVLWFTIHQNEGIAFAHLHKAKVYSIPKMPKYDGGLNYEFRTICQDPQGNIWCSTFADGVFLLKDSGQLTQHFHPDRGTLPERQVNHMMIDKDQNLLLAGAGNIWVRYRNSQRFEPVLDTAGRSVPFAVYFHQLKNGEILVATLQKGIFRIIKEGRWQLKQVLAPKNDSDYYTSIYEDSLGSVYISHEFTELSVFNFSKGSLQLLTKLPLQGFVNGFLEDENGRTIWVATSSGLARLDKTNLQTPPFLYTEKDGLSLKNLQSIVPGKPGEIWLSTSSGLIRFDPGALKFHLFSLADGIQSTQFDPLAALRHQNGTLWFGGNNGITIVDPQKIQYLETPPWIHITDLKINDGHLPDLRDQLTEATNMNQINYLKLRYRQNTLSFEFVATDYSDPKSTRLEYYLEKIDKNWVRLDKSGPGFARYPNIPPGHYTFRIRGTNSDGFAGGEVFEKKIFIHILPPFWLTWWFISLSVLSVVAAFFQIMRYRVRQAREKEQLNTRVAENKLAALRAQMNPHFIFNSLNSINSYILGNDVSGASRYLAKFAKLMRYIFDLSLHTNTSLEKEIEVLQLYLEVEVMRFKNPFTYVIEVDNDIDTYDTQIPTMLLQPFVENAIWHGLAHKETSDGQLKVHISRAGQLLKCSIHDNGVGRQRAAEIKAQKGRSHRSGAMENIRERLSLLPAHQDQHSAIEIQDLFDEQGRPAGTLVEITLPTDFDQ